MSRLFRAQNSSALSLREKAAYIPELDLFVKRDSPKALFPNHFWVSRVVDCFHPSEEDPIVVLGWRKIVQDRIIPERREKLRFHREKKSRVFPAREEAFVGEKPNLRRFRAGVPPGKDLRGLSVIPRSRRS